MWPDLPRQPDVLMLLGMSDRDFAHSCRQPQCSVMQAPIEIYQHMAPVATAGSMFNSCRPETVCTQCLSQLLLLPPDGRITKATPGATVHTQHRAARLTVGKAPEPATPQG